MKVSKTFGGYSLEVPQRDISNEYHNMFSEEIRKISIYNMHFIEVNIRMCQPEKVMFTVRRMH